jgi:acyl-CoA reductase-like NAD-dependent aldehyde dehydrogenase
MDSFDAGSAYQSNVLFCPDIAIYKYDTLDSAIECINGTDATMAVSFIGDPEVLEARRDHFHAPNLLSNLPTVEVDATLPLAGRLHSGGHRFHGPGIALYLCYPQVVQVDAEAQKAVATWPWPKF